MFEFKKQRGMKQLEEVNRLLDLLAQAYDVESISYCQNEEIAKTVDWKLWNHYHRLSVPGAKKQPMEMIEQSQMLLTLLVLNLGILMERYNVEDAYKQFSKQHNTLRDIAIMAQDVSNILESMNIYPMHRSKRAERNRERVLEEMREQRRANNNG
jgi:hypothetical protein